MKDYNEITKDLLERRDRYIADKKTKKKKAISVVVPVCCVSIISLLVLGVLRGDNLKDTLQLSTTEQNQSEQDEKNQSAKVEVDDKDKTETTKINKGDKGNEGKKPNNKKPNKPSEDDVIASEEFSEMASDFNSDLSSGRLPNKDHSNNKDHNQDLTQNETENPDANKMINKIVVTQMPVKTVYYVGDTFDFRGLEVTGYFSNGDVEDITQYVQIYNTVAYSASDKYGIYMEYTDNSEGINLAYTEFYVTVLPLPEESTTEASTVIEEY